MYRCHDFAELAITMAVLHACILLECTHLDDYMESVPSGNSPVEVSAVFINCDLDSTKEHPESGASRFERQQLYKHNALRDCNKKLAVTVKITNGASSDDEYVPIDHVSDGSGKKRVRLLDPYVLRLRRDAPLQAYKLRLIDTVTGILTSSSDKYKQDEQPFKRNERDTDSSQYYEEWADPWPRAAALARRAGFNHDVVQDCGLRLFSSTQGAAQTSALPPASSQWPPPPRPAQRRGPASACTRHADCSGGQNATSFDIIPKRLKRQHEQNIIIEEELDDKNMPKDERNVLRLKDMESHQDHGVVVRSTEQAPASDDPPRQPQRRGDTRPRAAALPAHETNRAIVSQQEIAKIQEENEKTYKDKSSVANQSDRQVDNPDVEAEKEFALYEIGNPDLWLKIHVQIYEKLTSDKGTTLWNDLTKGELVSVSSMFPEWSSPDINVQYRPADFVPREEYTLPMTSLCLLVPLLGENVDTLQQNVNYPRADNDDNYIIVVPAEDVLGVDKNEITKHSVSNVSEESTKTRRRRVVVRVARALWNVMEDNPDIATHKSEKYLTMRHRKPHHAQVELEVRADENQLVRVGSSGRVAIVVADSARRARATISVQATNTGLAAARFKAQINECDSGLLNSVREKHKAGLVAGPVLLPPRHTQRLLLHVPVELVADVQRCSVNLVNDNDESVAVREVVIRRGDRCFCVWHCDCVCYGENPKLPCQAMSEARQGAAGLAPRRGARFARSVCYADKMPLNIIVIIIGVIIALLFFGFLKAVVGLLIPCIGSWGLDRVLEAPRCLDRYHETALRGRTVAYDAQGWPVHPDTHERTVRVISKPMEFLLNILFFVVAPGLILLDLLKQVARRRPAAGSGIAHSDPNNTKKVYSSHDLQKREPRARRRRKGLHRWMTPQAEELSAKVWHKDLSVGLSRCEYMLPLLHGGRSGAGAGSGPHSSASDSEQEDTAFVLMHMQKSTESLARSQKKPYASGTSSAGHQMKYPTPFRSGQPDSVVRKHY